MSEAPPDELDELLGRRARERESAELDARALQWEAVARGELELEEAIAQRREAGDGGEALERAAAYFRPLDGGETAALVDDLLGGLTHGDGDVGGGDGDVGGGDGDVGGGDGDVGGGGPSEGGGEGESDVDDEDVLVPRPDEFTTPDNLILLPPGGEEPSSGEVTEPSEIAVHDPGGSRSWWIPGGMLVAAAAAILVWWIWPPNDEVRGVDEGLVAQRDSLPDPLPDYVLETDGGLKQLRGDTDTEGPSRHRYKRTTAFEWILRPRAEAGGEVAVRGFAFAVYSVAGLPLSLDELVKVADSGAIQITGEIAQLGLEPGDYTIALVIGRPDALPEQAAELAEAQSGDGWFVRRIELTIED